MLNYKSVHEFGQDEFIVNKSKFIGYASPISSEQEAIDFIEMIKKEHRDATHNVYAYVYGENSNIQRFSDDGEPSGTAGMPVLNIIKQENLRNVVVVVTRYFGGIKLGAGGLVRAYGKGAKIGLEAATIVDKVIYDEVFIDIDYTLLGRVENELNKNCYIIKDKAFNSSVTLNVLCRGSEVEMLRSLMTNITSARCDIRIGESGYYSIKDGKLI